MLKHYLQPLLAPRSVALVGATEREGALGAIVWRNLPRRRDSRGELTRSTPSTARSSASARTPADDLPPPPDLAVVVTPAQRSSA
jgi:acetyltransferase